MHGEQRIEAPRAVVWAALNDPEVLKACIPGCQSLEVIAEDRMRILASIKVGPITARFSGDVTLSERDPPNGYRISAEFQGGVAGFAKGEALVRLIDDGSVTILNHDASAQMGGKLAQLGGSLIDATAKQMADNFFKRLAERVAPLVPAGSSVSESKESSTDAPVAPAGPAAGLENALQIRSGSGHAAVLAAAVAGVAGFLLGRIDIAVAGPLGWTSLRVAILAMLVAGAAFVFGRWTAAKASMRTTTLIVDPVLRAALLEFLARKGDAK